jgi:hypothetical protein
MCLVLLELRHKQLRVARRRSLLEDGDVVVQAVLHEAGRRGRASLSTPLLLRLAG